MADKQQHPNEAPKRRKPDIPANDQGRIHACGTDALPRLLRAIAGDHHEHAPLPGDVD